MNKATTGYNYLTKLSPWKGTGEFSLTPIRRVLQRLGDPQDATPAIHVAGTNGKGSVSAATAAILGSGNYSVGLNTSPHLQRINERIIIDGIPVSDAYLGEFAWEVHAAAERECITLSFHEAITAISFLGFRESDLDWVVVEVGLGGRLDASNVMKRPAATAIVTIDYDHQNVLGNTIEEISREKAGIIKRGVPHITGDVDSAALRVISAATQKHQASHLRFGKEFDITPAKSRGPDIWEYNRLSTEGRGGDSFELKLGLLGDHQAKNMAVAATIALSLGIPASAIGTGIENVRWPGRLEKINYSGHQFIVDCAHNPAGIRSFTSYLDSIGVSGIELSFGVLDTKNWAEMVALLIPFVGKWHLFLPESERAVPQELIRDMIALSRPDISVVLHSSNFEGWMREILEGDPSKTHFITGSMYLVGRLRGFIGGEIPPLWSRLKEQRNLTIRSAI